MIFFSSVSSRSVAENRRAETRPRFLLAELAEIKKRHAKMIAMVKGFEGGVVESAEEFVVGHESLARAGDFQDDLPQQLHAVFQIL